MINESDGLQDYRLERLEQSSEVTNRHLGNLRDDFHSFSGMIKKWIGKSEREFEARLVALETENRTLRWVMGIIGTASASALAWHIMKLIGGD